MSSKTKIRDKKRLRKTKAKTTSPVNDAKMFLTIQMKTGMAEEKVKEQHCQFMEICPNGAMTKKKFVDLSKEALGDQADFLAESMFRVFDIDSSGTMDFTEYMLAINSTSLNSPEDKLKWMFDVFDRDGGGSISADEIGAILQGVFEMSGQVFEDTDLEQVTRDIMEAIYADGDGEVTKAEFIKNAMKSQFVAGMLSFIFIHQNCISIKIPLNHINFNQFEALQKFL